MFYVIALDNKEFIATKEELGAFSVSKKEEATIFNKTEVRELFKKHVRGDLFVTLNGDKKIKSIICYGFITEHTDVKAFANKIDVRQCKGED